MFLCEGYGVAWMKSFVVDELLPIPENVENHNTVKPVLSGHSKVDKTKA